VSNVHQLDPKNPFLGTWRSCGGFTDVEYTVTLEDGRLVVIGIDKGDGEVAEIRHVAFSAAQAALTFEAYWPSTGQLTKYRFSVAPRSERANVTYSFTAQETWERT
jgi:hypothetical protein